MKEELSVAVGVMARRAAQGNDSPLNSPSLPPVSTFPVLLSLPQRRHRVALSSRRLQTQTPLLSFDWCGTSAPYATASLQVFPGGFEPGLLSYSVSCWCQGFRARARCIAGLSCLSFRVHFPFGRYLPRPELRIAGAGVSHSHRDGGDR